MVKVIRKLPECTMGMQIWQNFYCPNDCLISIQCKFLWVLIPQKNCISCKEKKLKVYCSCNRQHVLEWGLVVTVHPYDLVSAHCHQICLPNFLHNFFTAHVRILTDIGASMNLPHDICGLDTNEKADFL